MGKPRVLGLAALVASTLVGIGVAAWSTQDHGSAAGPVRKTVIPAIAMDSVPPVTSTRDVIVQVRLLINEPAFTPGAITRVEVDAVARGPLPGPGDPPVVASGWMQITTHSGDACAWGAWVNGNLTVTYSQPQSANLQLKVNFSGAEWYYQVECGNETIRFPAGNVDESLTGWIGLIFPGLGGPGGTVIETPAYSGGIVGMPDCVKRFAAKHGASFGGRGEILVIVTAPPCMASTDPADWPD